MYNDEVKWVDSPLRER